MSCEQTIRRAIREAGGRVTTPRLKILAALRHLPGHHSADEIYERVVRDDPQTTLSRSTVYRTLETLQAWGVVGSLKAGSGSTTYEWAADDHHHLVCRGCGTVEASALPGLAQLENEIRRGTGFHADMQHLGIEGWCAGCAEERATVDSRGAED